ncbi:MAG: hypothetical protein WD024_06810 [Bacillota bacterium]
MRRACTVLAVLLALTLFTACSAPLTPEKLAQKIFGTPKKAEDSGIEKVSFSGSSLVIEYRLFPTGLTSYTKELGISLCPKLQQIYRESKEIDEVTILALGPFSDKLGNTTWKPMAALTVDRKLITQDIKWDTFLKQDLLAVAKDVQVFRDE